MKQNINGKTIIISMMTSSLPAVVNQLPGSIKPVAECCEYFFHVKLQINKTLLFTFCCVFVCILAVAQIFTQCIPSKRL